MTPANDNAEPRLHLDLPREQYDNLLALGEWNWSTLAELANSPAHLRYLIDHPESNDSDLFERGIAGHVATLEPSIYGGRTYDALDVAQAVPGAARYFVWPEANGKRGTKAWDAAEAECKRVRAKLLREKEHAWCTAVAGAVRSSPAVAELGGINGNAEVTLRWGERADAMTGRAPFTWKLRGRIDLEAPWGLGDLKSARDASVDGFMAAVARYEYHAQAAFYVDGYQRITGKRRPFYWIVVEDRAPHVVTVIEASPKVLAAGRVIYWEYLETLRACLERNYYPPYAEHVVRDAELPRYAQPDDDDQNLAGELGPTPFIGF